MRQTANASTMVQEADAGLTLVELLVVLVILGLIATVGGIQVVGYLQRARTDTAKLQLEDIQSALDLFRLDLGRVPTQAEGLPALLDAPVNLQGWRGPYLRKKSTLSDPWGRAWIYHEVGGDTPAEILSYGADGKPGGEGDDHDISSRDRL